MVAAKLPAGLTPSPIPPDEPKFLLDCMLGKVARWLVLLGYDARFVKKSDRTDLDIADEALRESRVLVTRDTRIPEIRGLRKLVLREQRFEDQLRRVIKEHRLKVDPSRLFSRCTDCNEPVEAYPREQAIPLVPPLVRELRTDFFRCPRCRHLYWMGTHVEKTIRKIERMGLL